MRFFRNPKKTGLAPGTLIHIGAERIGPIQATLISFTEEKLEEVNIPTVNDLPKFDDPSVCYWLNIDGISDVTWIEHLGHRHDIHPLVLEDILHTGQRPKAEDYDSYLYVVMKMLSYNEETDEIAEEQISLVLGQNFVISFQEHPGDVFENVRTRLRTGKGRIRKLGPGYLAYALIDAVVDHYFIVLEKLGERMESLSEGLMDDPNPGRLNEIYRLKRELLFMRKSIWPLREVIGMIQREESDLFHAEVNIFMRDVYDHAIRVLETLETLRDMVAGMLDIYLSSVSNRMNEVMKVLTIIATIFIPLTFIAGIYGMNFDPSAGPLNMPELRLPWGYLGVWGIMLAIVVGLVIYFRRKKWL